MHCNFLYNTHVIEDQLQCIYAYTAFESKFTAVYSQYTYMHCILLSITSVHCILFELHCNLSLFPIWIHTLHLVIYYKCILHFIRNTLQFIPNIHTYTAFCCQLPVYTALYSKYTVVYSQYTYIHCILLSITSVRCISFEIRWIWFPIHIHTLYFVVHSKCTLHFIRNTLHCIAKYILARTAFFSPFFFLFSILCMHCISFDINCIVFPIHKQTSSVMGWLRLVGSLKS